MYCVGILPSKLIFPLILEHFWNYLHLISISLTKSCGFCKYRKIVIYAYVLVGSVLLLWQQVSWNGKTWANLFTWLWMHTFSILAVYLFCQIYYISCMHESATLIGKIKEQPYNIIRCKQNNRNRHQELLKCWYKLKLKTVFPNKIGAFILFFWGGAVISDNMLPQACLSFWLLPDEYLQDLVQPRGPQRNMSMRKDMSFLNILVPSSVYMWNINGNLPVGLDILLEVGVDPVNSCPRGSAVILPHSQWLISWPSQGFKGFLQVFVKEWRGDLLHFKKLHMYSASVYGCRALKDVIIKVTAEMCWESNFWKENTIWNFFIMSQIFLPHIPSLSDFTKMLMLFW